MSWIAPVASAAIGMVGAKKSGDAANSAAAQAAPYNVAGPFGNVTYDSNHNANYSLGGVGGQFSTMAQGLGLDTLGNVQSNPLNALTPDINSAYGSAMGTNATLGANANANAGSLFSALQQFGNDPTAIGNHMYQLLSQQAQPGIDQATNALQQKLFSQGRLGTSGGGVDMQNFATGLGNADVGRQIQGATFGQQYQQQLQSQFGNAMTQAQGTAANRYQLATNLLQTGMGVNQANTQQATGLQSLYASLFQPLLSAQQVLNKNGVGNPVGAAYQYGAAQNQNDAITSALGQIAPGVGSFFGKLGGLYSGGFGLTG